MAPIGNHNQTFTEKGYDEKLNFASLIVGTGIITYHFGGL